MFGLLDAGVLSEFTSPASTVRDIHANSLMFKLVCVQGEG